MLRRLSEEKGILAMRDTNADGRADLIQGFGTATGTGMGIRDGQLYYSSTKYVFRSPLVAGQLLPGCAGGYTN